MFIDLDNYPIEVWDLREATKNGCSNQETLLQMYSRKGEESNKLFGICFVKDKSLEDRWEIDRILNENKNTQEYEYLEEKYPEFTSNKYFTTIHRDDEIMLRSQWINNEKKFIVKFPSIYQFKEAIDQYRRYFRGRDKVTIQGTVKGHGGSHAIVYNHGDVYIQGRDAFLGVDDNFGAYSKLLDPVSKQAVIDWVLKIKDDYKMSEHFHVFFEYMGGKIQGKASTANIPYFWSVFGLGDIIIDDTLNNWDPDLAHCLSTDKKVKVNFKRIEGPSLTLKEHRIFDVRDFGTYEIELNLINPEESSLKLAELTTEVENHCPIAAYFGIESDRGEGIVWHCDESEELPIGFSSAFMFKVKGTKHSNTKVKTLAPVTPEKIENINNLIDAVLTDNRIEQGINETGEPCPENKGKFLSWIVRDIMREERNTVLASEIPEKKFTKMLSIAAMIKYESKY